MSDIEFDEWREREYLESKENERLWNKHLDECQDGLCPICIKAAKEEFGQTLEQYRRFDYRVLFAGIVLFGVAIVSFFFKCL